MRQGTWERKIWEDLSDVYSPERQALRVVHDIESGFGEFLTVQRTPIIELNSSYGTSVLRDLTSTLNGGTIAKNNGEILMSTNANADGEVQIDSAEIGRYIPGFSAEIGIGARLSQDPVGTQFFKIGGSSEDDNNGLFWGKDATGWFIEIFRDGSSFIKKYRDEWNLDPVDGTGKSGYNIDSADGHIFQIDFTWYGYGRIIWYVTGRTSLGVQIPIPVHEESGFDRTSISSPNLKVQALVSNGGTTASNFNLYLGGRQYSIVGNYRPKFRITGQSRPPTSVGTTLTPLITFRRKSTFGDRSIKLSGVSLNVSGTAIDYYIILNGTVSTPTYNTPSFYTAAETALEVDVASTTVTGGNCIYSDIASAGQGNQRSFSRSVFDVDIPNGQTVILAAKTDTGTADVKANFRLTEEW